MIKRTIAGGLSKAERETHISCTYADDGSFIWTAESSIPTHITKLTAAGWKCTAELYSDKGQLLERTFETRTKKPLSFRNLAKIKSGAPTENEDNEN